MLWAVHAGVTKGVSDTAFAPNNACTRGQIVSFLHRSLGEPDPGTSRSPFTDVNPKAYYYLPMLWAVKREVTVGTSSSTFAPGAVCTRGQIVTFLYRTYG